MNWRSNKPSAQMLTGANVRLLQMSASMSMLFIIAWFWYICHGVFSMLFRASAENSFLFSRKTYGSYGWLQLNWIARERKQPRRDLNNCWIISVTLKQFAFASLPYGSYLNVRRDHLFTVSAASINTVVWATGEVIGKSWSVSTMQRAQPTARCIC